MRGGEKIRFSMGSEKGFSAQQQAEPGDPLDPAVSIVAVGGLIFRADMEPGQPIGEGVPAAVLVIAGDGLLIQATSDSVDRLCLKR